MNRQTSRAVGLAVTMVLLPACSSQMTAARKDDPVTVSQPAKPEPSRPLLLTFKWPDRGSVRVQERVAKKGGSGLLEYTVSWSRVGQDFRVKLDDVHFLEINGEPIDTAEKRKAVAEAMVIVGAIPGLVVDAQGELKDVVGMEEVIDRVARMRSHSTPEQRAKIAAWMKSPQMLNQLKQKATDFWSLWVGAWSGLEVPSHGELRTAMSVAIGEKVVSAPTVITVKPAPKGRVLLVSSTVLEGPEAAQALQAYVERIAKDVDAKKAPPEGLFRGFKRNSVLALETDPATLMPLRASSRMSTKLIVAGKQSMTEESHEYVFYWP